MMAIRRWFLTAFVSFSIFCAAAANDAAEETSRRAAGDSLSTAKMLTDYYHQMSAPQTVRRTAGR